jgi:hypothetical protein
VDPEEQLLRITDIVLTEIKEEDNGEEEINDEGEVVQKGNKKVVPGPTIKNSSARPSLTMGNLPEEPEDHDVDLNDSEVGMSDKKDRFRRAK